MSTTTRKATANLATVELDLVGFREMRKVAVRYGLQIEVERLDDQIAEWEGEADFLREELLSMGYEPS